MRSDRVARLLLERGRIARRQFDEATRAQSFFGGEIESHLLKLGHVREKDLGDVLSEIYGVPYASAEELRTFGLEVRDAVPRDLLERLLVCPFAVEGGTLRVAMLEPRDRTAVAEVERASGMTVEAWVTCEHRLHGALERHWRIRPEGVRAIAPAPPDPRIAGGEENLGASPGIPSRENSVAEAIGLDGLPLDESPPVEAFAERDWTSSPEARAWIESEWAPVVEAPPARAPEQPRPAPRTTRELGEALADARDRSEITDAILAYALDQAARAALFAAGRGTIRGVAGAGRGFEDITKVSVRPGSGTVFDLAGTSGDPYVGPVPPLPANRDLYTALGGRLPRQVVIVPIAVTGRISAYLYLDGEGEALTRPELPVLRRVAAMAGLAFEMLLLRTKLREG